VTERARSPEREDVWLVRLFDMPLYTFTEAPQHPVDYLAPNYFSSTHPRSIFTQHTMVQRWDGDVQVGLVGRDLTERLPDGTVDVTGIPPSELGAVLRGRFGLDVDDRELAQLRAL
jgi:N-hydroxyarylamine O-acetyltransferase